MNDAAETELKLRLHPAQTRRVTGHPVVRAATRGAAVRRHLVSIYYDTPDLELRARGMAARLRKAGGHWLQAVKGDGQTRLGLHQRSEWEQPVTGPAFELEKVPDEDVREMLARAALRPAFVTDFWRSARTLHWGDGSQIELAVDHGEIRAGEHAQALCEVELELKRGHAHALYDLALALAPDVHMSVENRSKAERGYALLSGDAIPGVAKATAVGLIRDIGIEDAFAAILFSCLEHLEGNDHAVTVFRDGEGIHQVRVALRRLRAALSLFRPIVPRRASRALEEEAKWLNRELAPLRDWDVLQQETLVPLSSVVPVDETVLDLQAAVHQAVDDGWERALAAFRSSRYTTLLLSIGRWLVGRRWREAMTPLQRQQLDAPLVGFAGSILEERHHKLRRAGQQAEALTAEERHRLRIRVKKLRYTAESLTEIYPSGRTRRYLKALARLQSILGGLNDGAVAASRLRDLGLANTPAGRLVQGWHACRTQRLLADLPVAWERFAEQRTFWR